MDDEPINDEPINLLKAQQLNDTRQLNDWSEVPEIDFKKPGKKRLFLFLLIIAIVILLAAFFALLSKWRTTEHQNDGSGANSLLTLKPKKKGFLQTVKNFIFQSDEILLETNQNKVNILIMGIGGPGHDGPYLSDTNIILTVQPSTNQVAMTSVPRDLAANIDGYGWYKINHANAFGEEKSPGQGGEFARQVFAKTLNIDLPYYIRIDFKAFVDIIEAVGGVEIDVPRAFIDYSYPADNYGYQTVSFASGKQTMGGERALIYARSRHGDNGEGSDFARARRQQLVIGALKDKVASSETYLNPKKIQKIFESLYQHVSTNLDFGQIIYLANLSRKIDGSVLKTLVLDSSPQGFLQETTGPDGAYLLTPVVGNFDAVKNAIENIFSPSTTWQNMPVSEQTTAYVLPSANIEIQNGTWQIGLAARKKSELEAKGFSINSIGNCYTRPITTTAMYLLNKTAPINLINALARELNVAPTATLPSWLQPPTTVGAAQSLSTSTMSTTSSPAISLPASAASSSNIISTSTDSIAASAAIPTSTTIENSDSKRYNDNTDILIILGEDILPANDRASSTKQPDAMIQTSTGI